ncbi:MAG: hypothetical protein QG604_668 [Candidatus Dependentiae bacterium]|nr:hypothetical protein [Candidatus Dependentiae bacterium]
MVSRWVLVGCSIVWFGVPVSLRAVDRGCATSGALPLTAELTAELDALEARCARGSYAHRFDPGHAEIPLTLVTGGRTEALASTRGQTAERMAVLGALHEELVRAAYGRTAATYRAYSGVSDDALVWIDPASYRYFLQAQGALTMVRRNGRIAPVTVNLLRAIASIIDERMQLLAERARLGQRAQKAHKKRRRGGS